MNMITFNTLKIEKSRTDIKTNIALPEFLTPELAEFIGIMVGDGHLGNYRNKKGKKAYNHYEISISGNSKDEQYYTYYVNPLFHKMFNTKFKIKILKEKNSIQLRKDSKLIYEFLTKIIGIPQRKDRIMIPPQVLSGTKDIKAAFVRGLADADFCLTTIRNEGLKYCRIHGTSKSETLIVEVKKMLTELDIPCCITREKSYYQKRNITYCRSRVYINGLSRVKQYMAVVGFSNKNKILKFQEILNGPGEI